MSSSVTQTKTALSESKITVSPRVPRRAAVQEARQFVYDMGYANMNTINQSGQFLNFATSQVEYYVDCANKESSLLLIRVDMSSAFRNIDNGSPASLTIRTGGAPNAKTPVELASQKRIVLYGEFVHAEPTEEEIHRFFQVHPDTRSWQPGQSGFHKTYWTEFHISGIYYIGGFGDKHYIGNIPVDMYKDADLDTASAESYDIEVVASSDVAEAKSFCPAHAPKSANEQTSKPTTARSWFSLW